MSVRSWLNRNGTAASIITLVVAGVAVFFAYSALSPAEYRRPSKGWYTVDEGKTLFVATLDNIAPFVQEGKEAVRARVFTCDGGKTTFVAYLEKHTEEYKAKRKAYDEAMKSFEVRLAEGKADLSQAPTSPDQMLASQTFVKRPGDAEWVRWASGDGDRLVSQKCPNGSYADFIETYP